MRTVVITRQSSDDQGTFGTLTVDDSGWSCVTAELPWRNNERAISCIPTGIYQSSFLPRSASGKYKNVYHVARVRGRTGILIHAGNFVGDVSRGFKTDSNGCILVGTQLGVLGTQNAVLGSKKALKELVSQLDREPFKLWIIDHNRYQS